jgi:hypothetical protein
MSMIRFDCTVWLMTKVRGLQAGHRALAVVQAAGLATLLLAWTNDAAADSLGRLFFSTEERRTLDELRDAGEEPKLAPTSGEKAVAPLVDVISFDGKVERSGGGSTIWVNGRPVYTGNRTAEGIRVRSSRGTDGETRFELPPSDSGTTQFSLKAGQKVAVQNGRKFDAYEARPGEDAESVLGDGGSADSAPAGADDGPPGKGAAPGAAAPSPGG